MKKIIFRKPMLIAGVAVLMLMIVLGYGVIQYAEKQVKESLLEAMRPFQQTCHELEGCELIPQGWVERACPANADLPEANLCVSPPETSAYRGLVYRATPDEFVARWRYVADTELVVHGGRGKALTIEELKLE
ncbi:MAG: hypothetical protein ACRCWR_03705 [Saezia sp.]